MNEDYTDEQIQEWDKEDIGHIPDAFFLPERVENLDEIVLEDVKMVHFEVMEKYSSVWLGFYLNNGKIFHMNIGVDDNDRLYVHYSDETPK